MSCLLIFFPVGYKSGLVVNVSGAGITTGSLVAGSLDAE